MRWFSQCTREVLQTYYINLVRTHSQGIYHISTREPSSGLSSDSDTDWEVSESSQPSSPAAESTTTERESSAILIDTATLSPEPPHPPTLEQNMAFAAFRESSHGPGDPG